MKQPYVLSSAYDCQFSCAPVLHITVHRDISDNRLHMIPLWVANVSSLRSLYVIESAYPCSILHWKLYKTWSSWLQYLTGDDLG